MKLGLVCVLYVFERWLMFLDIVFMMVGCLLYLGIICRDEEFLKEEVDIMFVMV